MSRADWRAPGAYEELRSLDAPGFAWEYLRRNPDFQRDRARLEAAARRRVLSAAEEDVFAQRWGLRFRECRRIKVIAFRRGLTVADMLRELLAREFPDDSGAAP